MSFVESHHQITPRHPYGQIITIHLVRIREDQIKIIYDSVVTKILIKLFGLFLERAVSLTVKACF